MSCRRNENPQKILGFRSDQHPNDGTSTSQMRSPQHPTFLDAPDPAMHHVPEQFLQAAGRVSIYIFRAADLRLYDIPDLRGQETGDQILL